MKRNNIIFGSLGVIAAATFFAFTPWKSTDSESVYTQENLSALENKSANDARIWLEARYLDQSTGERITDEKLRQIEESIKLLPKTKALSFVEQGPDNIGGRTRAIQVDRTDNNIVWTGGVSGGLYKSVDGANIWERVTSYEGVGSPFISSIAQFSDGTLFVATGSNFEGWNGNGVWYSQDQGATWTIVPGTASLVKVSELAAPVGGTTLWLGTSSGLRKWEFGNSTLDIPSAGAGNCGSLNCTDDGTVFVASIGSNRTYVSNDSGVTWVDKSTAGGGTLPSGSSRMEYAISHELNSSGFYTLYAVHTGSNLNGMYVSQDNGNTWSQFVGASGSPSNLDIYRGQGGYNTIVSVVPGNTKKIVIGGIDIWKWEQNTNNPPAGGFEKLTEWFLSPSSNKYVHADNHEMEWDGDKLYVGNDGGIGITYDPEGDWFPANRGYNVTQYYGIAFDANGGVMGGAQDNGTTHNDHTGSTYHEFKEVSGGDGFECEISFFNRDILFSTSQFGFVMRSGDRGVTMDQFSPSLPAAYDPFGTDGSPNHPFHTTIHLSEYYDTNSLDSVVFIPQQNYAANDVISIPSATTGDSILYTTPVALYFDDTLNYAPGLSTTETSVVNSINGATVLLDLYTWIHHGTSGSGNTPPEVGDSLLVDFPTGTDTVVVGSLGTFTHYYGQNAITSEVYDMGIDSVAYDVAWDKLTIQDPYQSWFFIYVNANGGELWGTRNALRLASADQQWGVVARGIGGSFGDLDIEFSKDLNSLFIATGSSQVRRIDGLGSLYSTTPSFETDAFYSVTGAAPAATTVTTFSGGGGNVEGIAVNPSNPDDIVTFRGSSGMSRSNNNATSASPTFTNVGAITGVSPFVYDGIIDRDDPNIIVVGTSNGAFVTEDGGSSWNDASTGFSGTPVYEVRQSWRTWDEGNFKPGTIYIGTFGRGLWSSDSYLGLTDSNDPSENIENFNTRLSSFPNPTTSTTTLSFELAQASDVDVYVYNLSGRLVKTVNKKNQTAGSQLLDLDSNDLPRGTYIVKFSAGKQQASTKFVKL
ncbi:MAG: T9SS type A sorting domain-containing protein [Crocinitomicaceae bacterium]|nr:T9SS type A sorting domain-containing protein [Crocinitomicaceae bacterium]